MSATGSASLAHARMCACPFRAIRTLNHPPPAWRGVLYSAQRHSSSQASPVKAYSSSSTNNSSSSTNSSTHELVDWVTANGGSVRGVAPANLAGRDGASGWGLKATEDLQPGSRLISLPPSCQLSFGGSSSPALLGVIQQVPEELWGGRLAMQVLVQRLAGDESHFATYVRNLPRGVPGIPMFFSGAAIEAIDYPPIVEQVKKRGRWLHRFTRDVLHKLPPAADPFPGGAGQLDLNALGWALAVVTSRAFRLRGPTHPASMLPLVDMANHSFTPNAEVVLEDNTAVMKAIKQVPAGSPLLLNYGKLGNDFLLLDYGFIMPDNPYDRVALRFDTNLIDAAAVAAVVRDGGDLFRVKLTPWKEQMLRQLRLMGEGADLQVCVGGPTTPVEPRFLAAMRVLAAQFASEGDGKSLEQIGDWERPLNKANEDRVLRLLSGCLLVALSNFRSTLPDDLKLLGQEQSQDTASEASSSSSSSAAGEPLDEDMRLAVGLRVELKKVLIKALQALTSRMEEVAWMKDLKEAAVVPLAKGQKPRAATSKGFGAGGSSSNGKSRR